MKGGVKDIASLSFGEAVNRPEAVVSKQRANPSHLRLLEVEVEPNLTV
jgi:hypothetical protein